jgi:hypothetical protein
MLPGSDDSDENGSSNGVGVGSVEGGGWGLWWRVLETMILMDAWWWWRVVVAIMAVVRVVIMLVVVEVGVT